MVLLRSCKVFTCCLPSCLLSKLDKRTMVIFVRRWSQRSQLERAVGAALGRVGPRWCHGGGWMGRSWELKTQALWGLGVRLLCE